MIGFTFIVKFLLAEVHVEPFHSKGKYLKDYRLEDSIGYKLFHHPLLQHQIFF